MKNIILCILAISLSGCNLLDKKSKGGATESLLQGREFNMKPLVIGVAGQSLSHWSASLSNYSTTGLVRVNADYLSLDSFVIPKKDSPVTYGTAMIRLGDLLAAHYNRPIEFVFTSVGATTSEQWNNELYKKTIEGNKKFPYDFILFTQGEGDPYTNYTQYLSNIDLMVDKWRAGGISCPVYLSLTTNPNVPYPSPARLAQETLIRSGKVRQGPDLDALRHVGGYFGADGMHPNMQGAEVQAQQWFETLKQAL